MKNDKGQSPLDIALDYLYDEGCVLYLMSRGCGGDEDKAKLLCRACRRGKLGVVEELVKQYKVDPKSECDDLLCSNPITMYKLRNLYMHSYSIAVLFP